jgi:hypothetical protein
MGCYVNPKNEFKESFLDREGVVLNKPPVWEEVPFGQLPVVLINNGLFTAAGVAYCKSELQAFTDPKDRRPKKYYFVDIDKLMLNSDLKNYYK